MLTTIFPSFNSKFMFLFFNILFCELKQVQAAKMTSVFVQDNRHHLNLLM